MSVERDLKELLAAIEFRREVSALCTQVRRVDESDLATLKRLVRERQELVALLDELAVRNQGFSSGYDWGFKEWPGPVHALRAHLGLSHARDGSNPNPHDAEPPETKLTYERAELMSVRWAELAAKLKEQGG